MALKPCGDFAGLADAEQARGFSDSIESASHWIAYRSINGLNNTHEELYENVRGHVQREVHALAGAVSSLLPP
jgi:hypothetical protein